jgi:hypothetical protein
MAFLSDRAIQVIAENKIRAAIAAGEFDHLPGLGQPAAIFDEPYDPHWWIRRKLKREQLTAYISRRIEPLRHREHGERRMQNAKCSRQNA